MLSIIEVNAQFQFENTHQKKVTIPFELHSNLIVVPVIINNRIPMKFILDTGVRNAILTDKLYTDILNIGYIRKFTIKGIGGENLLNAYLASGIELTMPGIHGKGHTLLVLEEDLIELRNFLGVEVHGMIGYEIFNRFIIEVNYTKKLLTLHDPTKYRVKKRYETLDMSIEDTKPFIKLNLTFEDSTEYTGKFLIDTGASHGLLLHPASNDSIKIPLKTIDAHIGRGLAGPVDGQIGRIKTLKFSEDKILEDVISTFPYPNSYLDSLLAPKIFRNGSIGGGILSRFTVVFDYPRHKIYLRKNNSFHNPFFYNLSGITIKAVGSNLKKYKIEEVRKESNAYLQGIRPGDEIIAINNIGLKDLNLNQVTGFLNSKPNKKVTLQLQRGNEKFKIKFTLSSAI